MPNPRKIFFSRTLVLVSCRTEEGLPFVPVKFINSITYSALGRAQELYPVTICAFSFEANHFHFLLVVNNPEDVSPFVGYVKQEMAHGLNRLVGRRKKTIWCEGFDSPIILDSQKALEKFAYLLLNPLKDQIVSSMEQYPGVSSYSYLMNDVHEIVTKRVYRDSISPLENPEQPWREERQYRFDLEGRERTVRIKLSPYAWKCCFADTKGLSDQEVRKLMLKRITKVKMELTPPAIERNPNELKRQSILQPYTPTNWGRRMYCHSSSKELRINFLFYVKRLCGECKEAYKSWKSGDMVPFPPGLFPPNLPRLQNLNRRLLFA